MKEFNLDAALNGEPVLLRNGSMARVCYKTPDCYVGNDGEEIQFPLHGYVIKAYNIIEIHNMFWTIDGRVYKDDEDAFDIVGMWEEPELTSEQVLEKAYRENLKVTFPKALLTNGYEVIAKTKHNSYIIRNGSYIVDSCNLDDVTFSIYEEKNGNEPENLDIDNTITVTLPKPFKPKPNDEFWFIDKVGGHLQLTQNIKSSHALTGDGNYFRTESDAQAWLDAMKNALE